jgi:hypothetical protein
MGQKNIFSDKAAVSTAVVGVVLMAMTIVWRVNPAESSVVAPFLSNTASGRVIHLILLVTCMPVWIAAVSVVTLFVPHTAEYTHYLSYALMLVTQGLLFFAIGKLISVCKRAVARRLQ